MVSIPTIIEHRVSKEGLGREGIKPPKGMSNMGEIHFNPSRIGHPGGLSCQPSRAWAGGEGRRGEGREGQTSGERDDVVVLVAEASVAAPEAAADHVAHGVQPPAFRVPPRQHRCLTPARRPGLLVEGPRALLLCRRSRRSPAAPLAVILPTGRGRPTHPTQLHANQGGARASGAEREWRSSEKQLCSAPPMAC